MLSWSAWACDALWNLLPSDHVVNQRQQRDRLPSDARLQAAQDRVQGWWQAAYLQALHPGLPVRFTQEACALIDLASSPATKGLLGSALNRTAAIKVQAGLESLIKVQ